MKNSLENRQFDEYAENYDSALARGLSVSGEDKIYFARGRLAWLAQCLKQLEVQPQSVLDYGCGTGTATPFLLELIGAKSVLGTDTSSKTISVAKRIHESRRARFLLFDQYEPVGDIDLVFCNGVFHHIPPDHRMAAAGYIHRSLRSGGLFAFWENNPWNPGTLYVMSQCPFDRDAVTLTPPAACKLLRAQGFEILRWDFLFIFPRVLSWLRPIEPLLSRLPLGAQYQILCRKPS